MPDIEYSLRDKRESNSVAAPPQVTHARSAKASDRGRASSRLSASSRASISGALVAGLMGLLIFLVLESPVCGPQSNVAKPASGRAVETLHGIALDPRHDHHIRLTTAGDQGTFVQPLDPHLLFLALIA